MDTGEQPSPPPQTISRRRCGPSPSSRPSHWRTLAHRLQLSFCAPPPLHPLTPSLLCPSLFAPSRGMHGSFRIASGFCNRAPACCFESSAAGKNRLGFVMLTPSHWIRAFQQHRINCVDSLPLKNGGFSVFYDRKFR
ncbi:hypothetical protein CEXT_125961 [Caerostris extrusa]|uniref:Uncharacterized protein n=1 Tax=Caerostris extrusa TaxID=172846 RepID=A0AAV4X7U8_CAEEX|nr:hypothetical protein CEXT_125961 [Caerostris extrusa]